MKRRHFVHTGLAAIACSSTLLTSCEPQARPPLKLGSNVWPGYEPLYLARELGYYSNSTIQLVSYPAITEVSRAFRNGDLDIAALTLDETLVLAETNPEVRVILVTDVSNGADVMMAKPSIQSVKDLKGKRVGAETTALGAYMLVRALEQGGVKFQDIQVVSLGTSEHEGAFKQGLVDAVVTFEPTRSKLLQEGSNIVFDSSQIPGEIVDVLVTRQSVVEQRQDGLNHLLDGWFRALAYHAQNPQEGARLMARRQEATPQDFLDSLKLLRIPNLTENQKMLSQNDPSFLQGSRRLAELMVEKKLLKQAIKPESLLSDRTIQALVNRSTPSQS
jgi:NitT/TauT family transport system substrate-binding protein